VVGGHDRIFVAAGEGRPRVGRSKRSMVCARGRRRRNVVDGLAGRSRGRAVRSQGSRGSGTVARRCRGSVAPVSRGHSVARGSGSRGRSVAGRGGRCQRSRGSMLEVARRSAVERSWSHRVAELVTYEGTVESGLFEEE